MKMNKVQNPIVLGFIMAITSIFLFSIGNYAFSIEYTNSTNNKYRIEFNYPNIISLDWINPSIEENSMIIPITSNFKNSNQYKIHTCAQSYHKMIPKIYQDDESYWEGSIIVCAYGLYNYNVNMGDKYSADPLLRIQIGGEAEICMLDDHCMKKINQIIKGNIALPSTPTLKDSSPSIPPPQQKIPPKQSPQEEEKQIINLCLQNLNAEHLPVLCQNLTPDLKEKVKNEAQKLGVSAQKLDDYKNITFTQPQVNQDEEEQPWEIGFCAKRVYYSNHLPPFCEDQWKEIEIEVQKLKEKDPTGGYKGDLTKRDNKDDDDKDEDDDDKDEDDDDKDEDDD